MHSARKFLLLLTLLTVSELPRLSAQDQRDGAAPNTEVNYTDHFVAKTMRVDYYHSGDARQQHFALDRVTADGPWAGPRDYLVDTMDLGEYRFAVRDQQSQQLLYLRGFCSIFGEWQTTEPAKTRWGTFHESLRFPWPKKPVALQLSQRLEGQWQVVWSETIDPSSRFVTDAETPRRDRVWELFCHGDPFEKVDLVILGDGYADSELSRFRQDATALTESLFSVDPFASRRADFNVRAIDVPATVSGVSHPREKQFRRSPLGCEYNTFDLPRYVLTFQNRTVRDVAAQAPYDYLIILLNDGTYGGGGIYHDQTIVAAHHDLSPHVMIHEFGHHLAGLADEYYSSNVAYETGKPITIEPWEPNVTALLPGEPLKWNDLVKPGTPIPTPWNQELFDAKGQKRRSEQGAQDAEATAEQTPEPQRQLTMLEVLTDNQYFGQVGAFQGARYESHGLFRPTINCVMFSRSTNEFCPVCRQAIERVIDTHVGAWR